MAAVRSGRVLRKGGFEVMRFEGNMFADEDSLGEFELRLRKSVLRYRDKPLCGTAHARWTLARSPSPVPFGR